jgi:hypothetical protein
VALFRRLASEESITLAFWKCSLDVRFTVECVFDVIFGFFDTENDMENEFDSETHVETAHPKRRCNRSLKEVIPQYSEVSHIPS